jgi:hypothetical protein
MKLKEKGVFLNSTQRSLKTAMALAGLLQCAALSHGQLFVDLPDLVLSPSANQNFDLFINNSGSPIQVEGLKVTLIVEDGGALDGISPPSGPQITGLDLLTGTLFEANNNGHLGFGAFPGGQVFEQDTITASGFVTLASGSSKFATVTFDATGWAPGTYDYTFYDDNEAIKFTPEGSLVGGSQPSYAGGTLTVVPEPGSTALVVGFICLGIGAVSRMRKR